MSEQIDAIRAAAPAPSPGPGAGAAIGPVIPAINAQLARLAVPSAEIVPLPVRHRRPQDLVAPRPSEDGPSEDGIALIGITIGMCLAAPFWGGLAWLLLR